MKKFYSLFIAAVLCLQASAVGVFEIPSGSKIVFAPGNLQYQAGTDTWRFAEHQYDMIGAGNAHIAADYNGWIDLFGWGTGVNPTAASQSNDDYAAFSDWGANAISNGGNEANLWRTPTKEEWNYLVYSRSGDSRGSATVNGVHGYIFLPDDWTLPDGVSFNPSPDKWEVNMYSEAEWNIMEQAGAVFFPAAGVRDGKDVKEVDNQGDYWSATPSYSAFALRMEFVQGSTNTGVYDRYIGRSVRLVRDYDGTEAIGEVPSDQVQCTKMLRDGQLLILRNDKTYTAQGAVVK